MKLITILTGSNNYDKNIDLEYKYMKHKRQLLKVNGKLFLSFEI